MVERSTTTVVSNVFGPSSRLPLDRALGAAVTVSAAVLAVQFTVRYIGGRKLHAADDLSWFEGVLSLLRTLVREPNARFASKKDDTMMIRRGSCHCRSVRFEVSPSR